MGQYLGDRTKGRANEILKPDIAPRNRYRHIEVIDEFPRPHFPIMPANCPESFPASFQNVFAKLSPIGIRFSSER